MNTGASNPLGKYAVYIAVLTTVVAVGLAFLQHMLVVLGLATSVDSFIDNIAILAVGIIFGGAGGLTQLNGTVRKVANLEAQVQSLQINQK